MSKPWRSASIRGDELLLSKKFSCCFCLNVVTASFFIGVTGFISCVFYLLVSVLASFTYNIVPASVGVLNYGFLIVGQFTKRPCFYSIYIITNLLGIFFYTLLICFLIAMLIWMPTSYVEFVAKNIERDTHTKFSLEGLLEFHVTKFEFISL
ncbi:hypothetical protein M3Y96_00382200 [Aphelenchoides besseyi]|nr:hypothetical protein M3Y96_00382200 [Aphelenchoides besseyi]